MSERNDGGPAFPAADRIDPSPQLGEAWFTVTPQKGMSLRDYFAAKAMQGMFAGSANPNSEGIGRRHHADLAECAYQVADAMLAERSK